MAVIFDPTDETFVDDQRCGNCRWWNPDLVTDEMKCENFQSEFYGKKRKKPSGWCWAWTKNPGKRAPH